MGGLRLPAIRNGPAAVLFIQGEMATHVRKAQKVPICGMHDRPIGDGKRRDLCIGDQIAGRPSRCGKQLEDSCNVVGR